MNIARLWSVRKYIVRWVFVDARVAWGFVCAGALAAWAVSTKNEVTVKLAGVGLQLAGVAIAVFAVVAVGRLFELPSIREKMLIWWRRRPFAAQRVVSASASGRSTVSAATVTQAPLKVDPNASFQDQIETLARNHSALFATVQAMGKRVSEVRNDLTKSIQHEERERAAQASQITRKLQQATASSPVVAVLGLYCIALGLILGTVPQELACLCLHR